VGATSISPSLPHKLLLSIKDVGAVMLVWNWLGLEYDAKPPNDAKELDDPEIEVKVIKEACSYEYAIADTHR
jgi:hypothetical protein